jgi:flagellar biosynthetic protein FliR
VTQIAAGLLSLFEPGKLMLLVLVLSRVSGLVMIAPVYGSAEVPMKLRALFALTLTLLIAPVQFNSTPPAATTLLDFSTYIAIELALGFVLGLGIWIHLQAFQLAGQIVSQASGLSLADVFLPNQDTSIPVVSHLLDLCALAVFVALGGHRLAMEGFLETFAAIPPGHGALGPEIVETLNAVVAQSFQLGVRVAAPALSALLLATLVLGLIGRTLPQLNVMALGFGINAMLALAVLSLSLGAAAWALEDELAGVLDGILKGLVASSSG